MTGAALSFEGFRLALERPEGDLVLLSDLDLEVPAGGFVLLVGESGSGKSSLLRLLTGLVPQREPPPRVGGRLRVLGEPVERGFPSRLRTRVAAILQDEGLLDELTPRQNVELALRAAGRSRKLAPGLLAQVGLEAPPDQVAALSGGMRKRVAVARALAAEPDLLLCDEPTAGLDPRAAREIAALLREAHDGARGERTTLVITHDRAAFEPFADRILVLDPARRTIVDAASATAPVPTASGPSPTAAPAWLTRGERLLLQSADLTRTVAASILRLPPVHLGPTLRSVGRYVVEPAAFVILASAVIGGLATFFALRNNPLEGALRGQVLIGSGKVLVAVLIPLLAGFFFTARMAAGAAARIGTMQRTGQIPALSVMGLRPTDYLLTPLVWGMTVAMPVVTLVAIVGACHASLLAARLVAGVGTESWALAFFDAVENVDIRGVLWKSGLSGYLVALVTYHLASGPKRSGDDVGHSVNSSIVLGMAVVLAVHGAITVIQYS